MCWVKPASVTARRLANSGKAVPAAAGSPGWSMSGVSNAMPPASNASSDSIATSTPSAPTDTLTPLAFQNRLLGRTSWSFGASTNTLTVRPFLSSASS